MCVDQTITVGVMDNGVGFDTSRYAPGLGLRNIRNRSELYKGTVVLESSPRKGCHLLVRFPLRADLGLN